MKTLFNYPFFIYLIAGVTCLLIMIIIDYLLGAEAEHLNAWVIVNKLLGNDIGIPDSLAIRRFGLLGATAFMVGINMAFGYVFINLLRGIIYFIHHVF